MREGRLQVNERGFGFVDVGEEEDLFLPPHEAARRSTVTASGCGCTRRGGRTEAELVDVVERQRSELVGTYLLQGDEAAVRPHDVTIPGLVQVPPDPARAGRRRGAGPSRSALADAGRPSSPAR